MNDLTDKKMIEEECFHHKVYASYVLITLPPQYPWICSKCGEKGVDIPAINIDGHSYDEIERSFNDKKK